MAEFLDANQAGRLPFKAVGKDVTVWEHARIIGAENIAVGNSVIIDDFALLMATGPIRIGSYVHIAAGAMIMGGGECDLGDFVGLSGGVRVYTGDDDYLGGSLTGPTVPAEYRSVTRSFVRIGKHAIIGANSVILPGVTIGEGASVGALSLVNRDLEPWTIYVGAPARPIRERPRQRILELEAQLRQAQ
jgi:galactoside O-acetyltransferase